MTSSVRILPGNPDAPTAGTPRVATGRTVGGQLTLVPVAGVSGLPNGGIEVVEEVRTRHAEALGQVGAVPDERFDRITRMARQIFDVPISAVTLISDDRAWFRSVQGLEAISAPRCDTFCNTTVTTARALVVPDALLDPIFEALPTVVGDPGLRFYAGIPLLDQAGVAFGSFCIFDTRIREFSARDLDVLRELAAWAQQELVLSADVERARAAQQALLPRRRPAVEGLDVAGVCLPVGAVGGDFFDWDLVHGDPVFTLVDVMGKGTAAALVAATCRALLRARAAEIARTPLAGTATDPIPGGLGGVIGDVDRMIQPDLERTGAMITGFVGRYDREAHRLSYADAGHGLSLLVRESGAWERIVSVDLPIGVAENERWTDRSITLQPGDTFLCFSDGLFDLLGGDTDAFRQIASLVAGAPDVQAIVEDIATLAGNNSPIDDVTAVALRRLR